MSGAIKPCFRAAEYSSGAPYVVFEHDGGDDLPFLTTNVVAFDLPDGTTYEQAVEIQNYLNDKVVGLSWTKLT
jgi:hypothetical protein